MLMQPSDGPLKDSEAPMGGECRRATWPAATLRVRTRFRPVPSRAVKSQLADAATLDERAGIAAGQRPDRQTGARRRHAPSATPLFGERQGVHQIRLASDRAVFGVLRVPKRERAKYPCNMHR